MAHEYYLRFDKFTQSDAAADKEDPVEPDQIRTNRFLHIYVRGYLPPSATNVYGMYRQVETSHDVNLGGSVSFKFTITHYELRPKTSYLIRIADDFKEPHCLSSQVIDTVS